MAWEDHSKTSMNLALLNLRGVCIELKVWRHVNKKLLLVLNLKQFYKDFSCFFLVIVEQRFTCFRCRLKSMPTVGFI